jgi:hypothetical protein
MWECRWKDYDFSGVNRWEMKKRGDWRLGLQWWVQMAARRTLPRRTRSTKIKIGAEKKLNRMKKLK